MGTFLFAAICLIALTVLLLLRPWQRHHADAEASAREINTRIYRDQLAELDRDLAAGSLAPGDHAQARAELQRRLLDDTGQAEVPATPVQGARRTSMVLAVVLPIAATGIYALLGSPAALLPQPAPVAQGGADQHSATAAEVERMVAALAAKLEKNPDDPKGWSMLARSYHVMGRLPEADAAFKRVGDDLLRKDPVLLADYADTLAGLADGNLEGQPLQLVKQALQLDPDNGMALSLAATAAYKRKDFPEAARHWQRLLKQLPPESEDARWLVKTLAEIGAPVSADTMAAASPQNGTAAAVQSPASAAAPPGPAIAQAAAGNSGASVSGQVTLSPKLKDSVSANDTVFIFARGLEGSRMPLAVQRARVADLPLQFRLDDSLAISPQAKLSDAAEVRIEARISKSGTANPASGDLFGISAPVKTGTAQVALQIDQVRP